MIAAGSYVTYAYFSDRPETLVNQFEIGEDETLVIEIFDPNDPTPNKVYTKEVQMKNTANVDSYVRIRLDCSDGDVKKYFNHLSQEEKEPLKKKNTILKKMYQQYTAIENGNGLIEYQAGKKHVL